MIPQYLPTSVTQSREPSINLLGFHGNSKYHQVDNQDLPSYVPCPRASHLCCRLLANLWQMLTAVSFVCADWFLKSGHIVSLNRVVEGSLSAYHELFCSKWPFWGLESSLILDADDSDLESWLSPQLCYPSEVAFHLLASVFPPGSCH